jgi:hypothetical protein
MFPRFDNPKFYNLTMGKAYPPQVSRQIDTVEHQTHGTFTTTPFVDPPLPKTRMRRIAGSLKDLYVVFQETAEAIEVVNVYLGEFHPLRPLFH